MKDDYGRMGKNIIRHFSHQRLKYYCQLCRKQLKDGNAFTSHSHSFLHKSKEQDKQSRPAYYIEKFSEDFKNEFYSYVQSSFKGGSKIEANKAYDAFIKDVHHHTHLHSTKWRSLTEFLKETNGNGEGILAEVENGSYFVCIGKKSFSIEKKKSTAADTVKEVIEIANELSKESTPIAFTELHKTENDAIKLQLQHKQTKRLSGNVFKKK